MPWIFFTPYGYVVWQWMMEQRDLEFDHQRWDGESPAYLKE